MAANDVVLILDTGLGNVASVANIVRRVGGTPKCVKTPSQFEAGARLILPGVGAFDSGMQALRDSGLRDVVLDAATRGVPILGICLGMQMLLGSSEEGKSDGLNVIPGIVRRFSDNNLRIPHMGWNQVRAVLENPILPSGSGDQRFYFVHSYFCECPPMYVIGQTAYGATFASAIRHRNILGVQFHPEKSHLYGMELIKRFLHWEPVDD